MRKAGSAFELVDTCLWVILSKLLIHSSAPSFEKGLNISLGSLLKVLFDTTYKMLRIISHT